MIELIYTGGDVRVNANTDVPFNRAISCCSCNERYESNTNTLTLVTPGKYLITATLNAELPTGVTAGDASFALTANGSVIAGTTTTETIGATDVVHNFATQTIIEVYKCCCKTISLRNVGIDATVNNQSIIATKIGGECYA